MNQKINKLSMNLGIAIIRHNPDVSDFYRAYNKPKENKK
jgi:hypothetical protein